MEIINYYEYSDSTVYYNHARKSHQLREDYFPHSHEAFEIIFFQQGDIIYTVDGQRYKLSANDLVITRPFDIHCIDVQNTGDYERYNLLFDEKIIPFDLHEKLPRNIHVIHFDNNRTVINLFEKMDFYCQWLKGPELKMMMTNLIQEICVQMILAADSKRENPHTPSNVLVCAAIAYIDKNLLTLSGIGEICEELYITKSHLHHLFARYLKISPKKYINSKRLALAQREIGTGGRPTEIYTKYGFSDYSSFYRAYCSQFGRRPSEKASAGQTVVLHKDTLRKSPE